MKIFGRLFKLPLVLLAVIILLIFLHYFKILSPLENLVVKILAPVQNQVYILGVKINNFYATTHFKKDLLKSNAELEQKVKDLQIENAQLKTILLEQQKLAEQIDFLARADKEAISAKVIGKSLQPGFQTLILDKGQQEGVRINLPVVVKEGIMVGKVVKVDKNSCQVLLITDSHSSLAATIQNQNQTKGIVVGERGLSLKMDLIPPEENVQIGDIVVTSGLEADIPRGLVIGQIEQITSGSNIFFQQAFLQSLVNFDDLIIVSILKNRSHD